MIYVSFGLWISHQTVCIDDKEKKEIVITFPLISPSAAFTGKHATLDK